MTDFNSLERSLKGKTTEALAHIIFERGGYRVARLGVEELFREVKVLDAKQYLALCLEPALRTIPDLLVSDSGLTCAYQVEIKFRSQFDFETRKALAELIDQQRAHWPNTHFLVFVGLSPRGPKSKYFQNFVKVITPALDTATMRTFCKDSEFWEALPTVQDIFPSLKKSDFALDALIPILQKLREASENKDSYSYDDETGTNTISGAEPVPYDESVGYGIQISSRYDRESEIQEMVNFVDAAQKTGLTPYVTSLFYDTKSCCCTIELADGVDQFSPIADGILDLARETIGQFDWFGVVEHGKPLSEY